jgi:predicted HicB family RNase H-like nuclease
MGSMKEDVHVRIDKDVMTAVRVYAATQRVTLATAVEILLHQALNGAQS